MPSELRHGDACTNSGIVKGSFFKTKQRKKKKRQSKKKVNKVLCNDYNFTAVCFCYPILLKRITETRRTDNIKYGINGTGKTTIAKALRSIADNDELQKLQSFFSTEPASVSSNPVVKKVLVFDEEFVNRVVFKEDEVIDNTFEIFLKTSDYEIKKGNLDKHLASLHDIIKADIGIVTIKELLEKINKKFTRTATGNIRRSGAFKSMLAKNNIYNIPEELNEYQLFIQNILI